MSEQPERDVQFRINLPERFFDDRRVADIFEDAASRIEALEPDRDWDALLSAEVVRPDAPVAADGEFVRGGVCLLCGGGVLSSGEHIDLDRHAAEVERITAGATAPGPLRWKYDGGRGAMVDEQGRIVGYWKRPSGAVVTREQVEAGLWAWIESAAEGVTRENVNPRVLDLNRPRMVAALRAAGLTVADGPTEDGA